MSPKIKDYCVYVWGGISTWSYVFNVPVLVNYFKKCTHMFTYFITSGQIVQVYTKLWAYRMEPVSLTDETFARQSSSLTFTNSVGGRNGDIKTGTIHRDMQKHEIKGSPNTPSQESIMEKSGGIRLNNRSSLAEGIVKDCNSTHRRFVGSLLYSFCADVGSASPHGPPALPSLSS